MAYVQTISETEATGELAEIYATITRNRGKIAEVHSIQSLNPPTIPAHMELYRTVMFARSPLSRAEREMIAVVVSVANGCAYCVAHHRAALLHFWKDSSQCDRLEAAARIGDFDGAGLSLSDREARLCRFARRVTEEPAAGQDGSAVAELELSDREALDATLVVGYFNFVNRIVLTLGVEIESDPGGYRYD
ncbi:MAG TPA: peroxidase-related enzyme [Alkalispirochaeta sp.]|nr:peroxidase-related enzyme [Alkalispirochaeta sp.]